MAGVPQRGGHRGVFAAAVTTVMLVVVGAIIIAVGLRGSEGPPEADQAAGSVTPPAASAPSTDGPDAPTSPGPAPEPDTTRPDFGPFLPGSAPVALDIPSIDVHSDQIVGLGLQDDGTIEVPRNASQPGWFTPGPSPGQLGPAVIAGHVDSTEGPAVFYKLGELRRGELIEVTREDGSVARFSIDRVETYEKAEFPTRTVYGNTSGRAELRLITCSGDYDKEDGYLSNTIAFAHLVA